VSARAGAKCFGNLAIHGDNVRELAKIERIDVTGDVSGDMKLKAIAECRERHSRVGRGLGLDSSSVEFAVLTEMCGC
jgi:hypothetical protein